MGNSFGRPKSNQCSAAIPGARTGWIEAFDFALPNPKRSRRGKVTLGPSVGCRWSGEPPMGRASSQTYPKHVEATLRLLDR